MSADSTTSSAQAGQAEGSTQPALPSPRPRAGQDERAWREEVARLRVQHDALALANPQGSAGHTPMSPQMDSVTDRMVPVDGGDISTRVYRPQGEGALGALLLFHGGAFWMGGGATSFELNDALCRAAATQLSRVVVNVDYRLAPEFRFPVQLEDGYAALVHVSDSADELGIDPTRLGLIGVSSGGLLAAGLTHLFRERGGPSVDLLMLLAPLLDLSATSDVPESHQLMEWLRSCYVDDDSVDVDSPVLAPLKVADLSGLPATVIVTGTLDPLTPQGSSYVSRLAAAGVNAIELSYPMGHTDADADLTRRFTSEMLAAAQTMLP